MSVKNVKTLQLKCLGRTKFMMNKYL